MGPLAKYLLYTVFAAYVLYQALASQAETRRMASECRRIRTEIAQLHQQNARRLEICKALNSDPFYVERLLRERYGYRSPSEEKPPQPTRTAQQPNPDQSRRVAARNIPADGPIAGRTPRRTSRR